MNAIRPFPRRSCSRGATRSRPRLRAAAGRGADVIAADSGLHVAEALGLHVDLPRRRLRLADPAAVEAAARRGDDRRSASGREGRDRPRARARRRGRRAARAGSWSSTVVATGSTTCSAISRCWRRRASPVSRSTRSPGPRASCGRTRRRAARHDRRARRAVSSRCSRPAVTRAGSPRAGLQYPLQRRRPAPGNDARRQQRARRRHGIGAARGRHAARGAAVRRCAVTPNRRESGNERGRAMIGLARDRFDRRRVREQRHEHAGAGQRPRASRRTTVVLHDLRQLRASPKAVLADVHRRDRLQGEAGAARRRGRAA